mgnify:CR=1 FL=1
MLRTTATLAALLATLGLFALPASAQEGADESEDGPAKIERGKLDFLRQAARRLERDVRRLPEVDAPAATTPDSLASSLNARRDPARVFEWFREHIRYEPYEGAVRGARGTLISRRANGVDQALLARAIFEEAGVESRFATGDVPDKAWEKLGGRLLGDVEFDPGSDDIDVASTLRGWDDLRPSDHVWLEVEHDGEFKAFDPVLAERFGTGYSPNPARTKSLPSRLLGSFRMSVHSLLDDGQEDVVNRLESTPSQLMGEPITLSFEPHVARDNHVESSLRIGDKVSDGKRIPTDALDRLWVEFEIDVGGRSYRMQKTLFADGATPELFAHDQQVFAIGVLPGWVGPHWAREQIAGHLDALAESIQSWAKDRMRASKPQTELRYRSATDGFVAEIAATLPLLYATRADRTPLALAETLGVIPVMSTPRIVVSGVMRSGSKVTIDFWREGGEVDVIGHESLPDALSSGVAAISGYDRATAADALFDGVSDGPFMGVEHIFELARANGIPFETLHARRAKRIERLGVPDFHQSIMREHVVEGGELILAPQRAVTSADQPHVGWWSITPSNDEFRANAATTYSPAGSAAAPPRDVTIAAIIRAGMSVESEMVDILRDSDPSSRICSAADDGAKLSRAFCAQKKLQPLPSLEACLKDTGGQGGLLGAAGSVSAGSGTLEREEPQAFCNGEARRSRCGLVVVNSILAGRAHIRATGQSEPTEKSDNESADSDASSKPAPYCR